MKNLEKIKKINFVIRQEKCVCASNIRQEKCVFIYDSTSNS